ncbi:sulfatase [Persicitalea sp.]|uniref:sulfatase family protein n=1 Tax=Persicitalea sp. TaxID=3100273 RepID=UPI00359459F3
MKHLTDQKIVSNALAAIVLILVTITLVATNHAVAQKAQQPNFIVIFTDDQGYGDVGCFGHPTIKTPNLDRMAHEGQKWTSFYVAANVCTPSRAALMTGRLPIRSGMFSDKRRVLFPDSDDGLPQSEITIARHLKKKGYRTAAIGKWHLGHLPAYLPTSHGFDSYLGIPYSNDMDKVNDVDRKVAFGESKIEYFQVPLLRDTTEIQRPADQNTIVKRYTEEAIKIIQKNKKEPNAARPFFLYMAHSLPHVPLFASKDFLGTSKRGLYGDVIEEIDWSVGQILSTLKKEGLDKNTYVVFTSDNGPWAIFNEQGGSSGLLFGNKGTSYEGGVRVPTIFWGPGRVKPGVVSDMGSTLDLLPTFGKLAGIPLPTDRIYDGYDLSEVLHKGAASPRDEMYYYHGSHLFAARKGAYKLLYYQNNPLGYPEKLEKLDKHQLFNLLHDPSEKYDLADEHPEVIREIEAMVAKHREKATPAATHLEARIGQK